MSRARRVVFALMSVCALCGAVSAAASAHKFVIEGKEIAKGEVISGESVATSSSLETQFGVTKCKKSSSKDEFEAEGKSKATVTTSECSFTEKSCKFAEPIEYKVKEELVIFKEKLAVKVMPASGETFTTTHITGCTASGEWSLRGSQITELPEAEVEKVEHEYVIAPSGSSLSVAEGRESVEAFATGKGSTKLTSGKKWSSKK
jgi:hypothetical protein